MFEAQKRVFKRARLADEPSAEIARVESLSLWRRANLKGRGVSCCARLGGFRGTGQ